MSEKDWNDETEEDLKKLEAVLKQKKAPQQLSTSSSSANKKLFKDKRLDSIPENELLDSKTMEHKKHMDDLRSRLKTRTKCRTPQERSEWIQKDKMERGDIDVDAIRSKLNAPQMSQLIPQHQLNDLKENLDKAKEKQKQKRKKKRDKKKKQQQQPKENDGPGKTNNKQTIKTAKDELLKCLMENEIPSLIYQKQCYRHVKRKQPVKLWDALKATLLDSFDFDEDQFEDFRRKFKIKKAEMLVEQPEKDHLQVIKVKAEKKKETKKRKKEEVKEAKEDEEKEEEKEASKPQAKKQKIVGEDLEGEPIELTN